jgi:hypothetical protein
MFPQAEFDDGPDALEMAIRLLQKAATASRPSPQEIITI